MWSAVLEKGSKYNQDNDVPYMITQAALEHAEGKKGFVSVYMSYEEKNTLLCTLKHNEILQVPLNLQVAEGNDVQFYIKGDGKVHLSGFIDVGPYDDMDEEMDEDESDVSSLDDEELTAALKRKPEAKSQPAAKKAKVANGVAAKPVNGKAAIKAEDESDEDDDEDEEDDESDEGTMDEADLQQLMKSIKAQKAKEGGAAADDSDDDSEEDEEDSDVEVDMKQQQNKLKDNLKQIKPQTPKQQQGGKNQQQTQQQKSGQKPNQQSNQKGKQNNSPGNKFGGNKNTPNQNKKVSFGGQQGTPGNQNKGKFNNKGGKFSGQKQRN